MIKKIISAVGLGVFGLALVTKAAVDSDLTATLASSTALITDNKFTILAFVSGIVALVLVISLGKAGLMMAKKWITAAFAGRGKK